MERTHDRVVHLMVILCALLMCVLIVSRVAKADDYDFFQKVDEFLDNPMFAKGTYWNNQTQKPKTYSVSATGCNAYMRDFVHECWKGSSTNPYSSGTKFTDTNEITTGDIIYIEGSYNGTSYPHWYVVIQRENNGGLLTAEAASNYIRVGTGYYSLSKPGSSLTVNGVKVTQSFQCGYHMPEYESFAYGRLEEDFYAVILNTDIWKPISLVDGSDLVYLKDENGSAKQVWRFQRQADHSYVITSCDNGNALEMTDGIRTNGTQMTAHGYWGGAYQRWLLITYGNSYIFHAKHYTNEKWAMDLRNNLSTDGTPIQIYTKNKSKAQIWSIYRGNDIQLKGPTLRVTPGDSASATYFSWDRCYGANKYNLRIFKEDSGSEDHTVWNVVSTSSSVVLPAGSYRAYVDAINYHTYNGGPDITFTVKQSPILTLDQITAITTENELTVTAGETGYLNVGTVPAGIDINSLTYTLDSDRFFEITEDHGIFCKYAEGTSEGTLTITAPNGVSKQVQLTGQSNIMEYDVFINGLPYNYEESCDIYKVGQTVPYQVTYSLSNEYDPGYEISLLPEETFYNLDTSAHTITFLKTVGPYFKSIDTWLPAAGWYQGYASILVTDDRESCYIPAQTTVIGDEAFAGSDAKYFFLPDTVSDIGHNAFPEGACVFLNTYSLNSDNFRENEVWFIESASNYNTDFAEKHPYYIVRRGTTIPDEQ